jgi:broad specificity phosphatase PhoE
LDDTIVDGELTAIGRQQARSLGEKLRTVRVDQIYPSTLERAFETALSISENNIGNPGVLQNEALVEREIGSFKGQEV